MNIILAISTVSLAVQAAACLVALAISQAPGWRRARIAAVLAGTAGLYSMLNIVGVFSSRTDVTNAWVSGGRLSVAAAHVTAWIWFSYSDGEGRWRSVPRKVRWVVVAHLALTFLVSATGNANDASRLAIVAIESLGVRFVQPALTPVAMLSVATSFGFLVISFVEQVRQARRGVVGAKGNVLGFVFFVACAVEEILVASNVVRFIYLAELGYLGLVMPMVAQFVHRFIGDAHRLQVLTAALESEVQVATGERDHAREALAAQERFAALGRMAGGVGHEINNPLQILTLSLDELRETPTVTRDPDLADVVEHAVAASERIRRIVAGLRTYALPGEPSLHALAPAAVVRDAIAAARREQGPMPEIHADLHPAPEVLVDRERMLQALGHAIANAVRAVSALPAGTGRVELRTRTTTDGDALIEIRDTGGGFPLSVLSRLGEPFVTTQAPGAGLGLGVFIIRGVVAAHAGTLELENLRGGGACLRILLPPASHD